MTKVSFPFRFVIDYDFFENVMKSNPKLFMFLMYISSCSKDFKRKHNLMSEAIRNKIIKENPKYGEEYIKASLNKVNEPLEIEKIEDEIVRNIQYAVYYATKLEKEDNTTKMCILTSEEKKEEYIENKHLKNVKNVSVRAGKEAITLLEDFTNMCWEK